MEVNDKRKVQKALADIYYCGKKFELALDVHKLLAKKFHTKVGVWMSYIDVLFALQQAKSDAANPDHALLTTLELPKPRDILSRALQALDKRKHVKMILKYGQVEYKYGNTESGRTMFEGVVTSYPKKTDAWGVYIDMEVKYGQNNKDYIRNLFERCLKLDLKPKSTKFFYKKYLDYELAHGTTVTADAVRQKALLYASHIPQ